MKLTKVITILLMCLFAVPAIAQMPSKATMDSVREAVKAQKRAFVAVNMDLTEEEAAKFWPLYDGYQKELEMLNKKTANVIKLYAENYDTMTDETADQIMKQWMGVETERAKVRTTQMAKFKEVLSTKKLVRYFQIENKIQAIINFDLADSIPLMK